MESTGNMISQLLQPKQAQDTTINTIQNQTQANTTIPKQAQDTTTTVQSQAPSTTTVITLANDKKIGFDSKKMQDVKKEVEFSKAEIPLPSNNKCVWKIEAGDLTLLKPQSNQPESEIVIYSKKITGEISGSPITLKETTDKLDKDSKKSLEQQLTFVAVCNLKVINTNNVSGRKVNSAISPLSLMLYFEENKNTPEILEGLENEIAIEYRWSRAYTPLPASDFINKKLAAVSTTTIRPLFLPIGCYRKKFADELFDFLMKKGIFSPAEADYFKKICGPYESISRFEQETTEAISKALKAGSFDKVIAGIQAIHASAIQRSKDENVFFGVIKSATDNPNYLDQADAAFVFGNKLLNLSLKHALQAFDILEAGSPYFFKKMEVIVNFCLTREQNLSKLDLDTSHHMIQFLAKNFDASAFKGYDVTMKTMNLIFNLLEQQIGRQFDQDKPLVLLKLPAKLSELTDFIEIFFKNILVLTNKLYDFNSIKGEQKKTQIENTGLAIQSSSLIPGALKRTKDSVETSTLISSSADNKTKSEASKLMSEGGVNTKTSSDLAPLYPPPNSSSANSISSSHATTILAAPTPNTSCDKSNLEENVILRPPEGWIITHGDLKKFQEDTTRNTECIRLERKVLTEHMETQIKILDSSEQVDKPLIPLVLSSIMIVPLQISIFNGNTFTETLLHKGVGLVLIAPDPMGSKGSIGWFPSTLMEELGELSDFESYGAVANSDHLRLASLTEREGGSRILHYCLSIMREHFCDLLFEKLSLAKLISTAEACAIKELIKPWTKKPSKQELELLQRMNLYVTKATALHKEFIQLQQIKSTEYEKIAKNKEELTLVQNRLKLALDSAVNTAAEIHRATIEENRSQGLFDKDVSTSPLEDSDAGLELGKQILLLSPFHAFKAFQLITRNSLYFSRASECMASTAIDLAYTATSEKKRRKYRAIALKALFDVNDQLDMFLIFLELHAGYENLGGKGLFATLKAQKVQEWSMGLNIQILLILCDKLCELSKLTKKNHSPEVAGQITSSNSSAKTQADRKTTMAALSMGAASSSSSSPNMALTTSVSTTTTASPITFHSASFTSNPTSNPYLSSSKPVKSLEELSDEEALDDAAKACSDTENTAKSSLSFK